ncbi:MAG: D-alanine--D-alanine ligase [Gammaproteobacteria bacterium]|jgi:hypothetical protein|nr:D-alanine--D-alanine ligase [Gammaproteobacteria bacterium]MBT3860019.1 D-alanine--D-alanine ligase [Gammaproteobacteria bacterium]MBT3987031.1 D-alanine--D-alanine ligase [Gammaproteobacteria bacterium]MBT4254498.1 D-alanine--D-alanine ligase [Gammaproteobacteria bacterium]MBT4580704.1 D-alanine--D-alanine ligase [Gammaproteobacteria bacterium]
MNETEASSHVASGMPPLDLSGKTTSFFEFWPSWLMYFPVGVQWLLYSIRYRSLSLPLIANPAIFLSGMVGVAKSDVFESAGKYARQYILPWVLLEIESDDGDKHYQQALENLEQAGFDFPLVAKPNMGCRGAGVKLLADENELLMYIKDFPKGGCIQFQKLSQWEAEAGVFYVRHPDESKGQITSLTLKYTPYVTGDGVSTLSALVGADSRAGELLHLYRERHSARWQDVIPEGEDYRLVFSASHCRGAVFRDAAHLIDSKLTHSLDKIFEDIPGFYYGRLDLKFKNTEDLTMGKNFEIIEINGASSESINIWDRNTGLGQAIKTLLQQYGTLFKLGHANRRQGHKPPGIMALYKAWRHEKELVRQYPEND